MAELPEDQEILDLVDDNDVAHGTILRKDIYDKQNLHGYYLRAVNAFIMRNDGRIWIPRRTADKKIAPNGLDFSMGEHVMSGETYEQALARGFEEELNMTIDVSQLLMFYRSSPKADDYYFNQNYLYVIEVEPKYNPSDFVGAEWLLPKDVLDRMQLGELGKRTLVPVIEALLDYQRQS